MASKQGFDCPRHRRLPDRKYIGYVSKRVSTTPLREGSAYTLLHRHRVEIPVPQCPTKSLGYERDREGGRRANEYDSIARRSPPPLPWLDPNERTLPEEGRVLKVSLNVEVVDQKPRLVMRKWPMRRGISLGYTLNSTIRWQHHFLVLRLSTKSTLDFTTGSYLTADSLGVFRRTRFVV